MHPSIPLLLSLLGFAFSQDDGIGGCNGGSITGNRCCDGDVISSDGAGIDTSDISNLVCCVGGSASGFSFGGSSCAPDQTSVPFSELSTVNGNFHEGTTVIISNGNTIVPSATVTDTMETSAETSSMAAETSSEAMTSSAITDTASQSAEASSTDTSTGAAALMTSGPMAGALVMAGGFVMAAL